LKELHVEHNEITAIGIQYFVQALQCNTVRFKLMPK